jgi:integrase
MMPDPTGPTLHTVYTRLWDRARAAALTKEQYASPLARRPYDLRHAAVSTWLNGGVGPARVAEFAGHSVDVLLKIYAKCLDGDELIALRRIGKALGRRDEEQAPTQCDSDGGAEPSRRDGPPQA